MRIWLFSDLHLPRRDVLDLRGPLKFPDADVCVMPGDLCHDVAAGMAWLANIIRPRMRVVCVLGNHEFYHRDITVARSEAALLARDLGIDLLDDGVTVIGGVRFVGSTLWTDYELYGNAQTAMDAARLGINDHRLINMPGAYGKEVFMPEDALALHRASHAFLEQTLAQPHDGHTVVVTHHAPHPGSVTPRFDGDPCTPAVVSDLTYLIESYRPHFWLHGHVHSCHDYYVSSTRIVANPKGYLMENPDFDGKKVLEL